MKRKKILLKLKNDEQRKSVAKTFHDISKALIIAGLIDYIVKGDLLTITGLKFISVALLCVVAGLRIEESIGRNENERS